MYRKNNTDTMYTPHSVGKYPLWISKLLREFIFTVNDSVSTIAYLVPNINYSISTVIYIYLIYSVSVNYKYM